MNDIFSKLKSPGEICFSIAGNLRIRRKVARLSQLQLSQRAGVSLGSLKRFEQSGEIALSSLVKLAVVLNCEDELANLFTRKQYASIQEVIDEQD